MPASCKARQRYIDALVNTALAEEEVFMTTLGNLFIIIIIYYYF